jgi:hypothetical protein
VWYDTIQQQQQVASMQQISAGEHASVAGAVDSASSTAAAASSAPARGKTKSNKNEKCIVCMDALRDVLLLPCKHLVLCSGCAQQMEGRGALGSCPYCRQACVKRVRVLG